MLYNPDCRKCPLWAGVKSVCVRARGSDTPRVLFVGEAPGADEDEAGKPFVGVSGRLLQKAIDHYDVPDCRITNAVRCRPPDNRKPSGKEVKACATYLEEEVDTYKPGIIVALGGVPLKLLTGRPKITEWAGKEVGVYRDRPVFAMLHPSYILRDLPRRLSLFENGFKELGFLLRPSSRPKLPRTAELSPVMAKVWLAGKQDRIIAWDYETSDTSPWNGHVVRSVAFSDGEQAVWVNGEKSPYAFRDLVITFLQSPVIKAAHNLFFEFLWSLVHFGTAPVNAQFDTMLMHYLIDENKPHGLDNVAGEYLGAPNWDIHATMVDKGYTYANFPMNELGPYNALDAMYTAQLVPVLKKKLTPWWEVYRTILLPLAKTCARMAKRGVAIDRHWTHDVSALYKHKMKLIQKEFLKHPAVIAVAKKQDKPFNLNSPPQMARLLYKKLKLPILKKTKTGEPSTSAKVVEALEGQHPLVGMYLQWKEKRTLCGNYLDKFPLFADAHGLIHTDYKSGFVVTGRLSCGEPPMHGIPKDSLTRGMFISRFPGGKVLSADYKQLEVRLAVNEAGETELIEAIKKGLDVHDETAIRMYGKKYTDNPDKNKKDQLRKRAKTLNFGVIYGMSEYKLSADWHIPVEEAKVYIDEYWAARPMLARWMRKQHALLEERGYAVSRFGRWRRLDLMGMTEKERGHALRQAGNFPIQSAGADLTNLACILVDQALRKAKTKSMLMHTIHDSLLIDVYPTEVKFVSDLVVDIMTRQMMKRCPWMKVPLAVDLEVTDRFGGATEVA